MKSGFGHYECADKSDYKGEWLENKMTGRGKYKWADG